MSYDDILTKINLSTLKDRRDYLCKKYFIYICKLAHIKSTVYCPKKGMLTMIYDVVIRTHYLFLVQIDTTIP